MKTYIYLELIKTYLSNKPTAVNDFFQWKQTNRFPRGKTFTLGIPFEYKNDFFMCVEVELELTLKQI